LLFYEVPNLGLTPRFDGTALQSLASDLAESFNVAVLKGLAPIESSGLKVFTLDTYDLLAEIKADPSGFGFNNVSSPCWTGNFTDPSSGTLCSTAPDDQNKFLFWDDVHPTAAGHLLAAEFAVDALTAVPEVSTWVFRGRRATDCAACLWRICRRLAGYVRQRRAGADRDGSGHVRRDARRWCSGAFSLNG
jgi:phospholipase/lecithinase/hemolysin